MDLNELLQAAEGLMDDWGQTITHCDDRAKALRDLWEGMSDKGTEEALMIETRATLWAIRGRALRDALTATRICVDAVKNDPDPAALPPTSRDASLRGMEIDAWAEWNLAALGDEAVDSGLVSKRTLIRRLPLLLKLGVAAMGEVTGDQLGQIMGGSVGDEAERWLKGQDGGGYL